MYSQQSKLFTDGYRDVLENAAKERKLYASIKFDNLEDMTSVLYTLKNEGFNVHCEGVDGVYHLTVDIA